MSSVPERCADLSRAAGESLSATATRAERWLLVEVPGSWPRDVSEAGALPDAAHEAIATWLERTPRSKALFIRRPGRGTARPLAFLVRADESTAETRCLELASHDELADVDLDVDGATVEAQLVLVCGHGSRDACCALRGTAVHGALDGSLGDAEIWISSHHGGHRFAANALVLPRGIHLGRLDPDTAAEVTARALAGRIELGHYRGRTWYAAEVQAAEHALRAALDLDGVDDLRLVGTENSVVRFRARDDTEHAVEVEEMRGPPVPPSCGTDPEPQRTFSARVL